MIAFVRACWLVSTLLAPFSAHAAQDTSVASRLTELDGANPARVRELVGALVQIGDDAAADALDATSDAFAARPLAARRARSQIARDAGGPKALERALARLDDADEVVRKNLIALLASPVHGDALVFERVAALERLARVDSNHSARADAVKALARIDDGAACAALERMLTTCGETERVAASLALAGHPRARQIVVQRVQTAFATGADDARTRVTDDVLATLLEAAYGSALAEIPNGGESARDRAPFVLGARAAVPTVSNAARNALARFVDRARTLGDWRRADRMLTQLLDCGLDDFALLAQRALLALQVADDPRVAFEAGREICSRWPLDNDVQHREHYAHGALLQAVAAIALGRPGDANGSLDVAARVLESLRGERLDLRMNPDLNVDPQAGLVELRALVDVYRTLVLLALGGATNDAPVLERARTADELLLEAQRFATAQFWGSRLSLDDLFGHSFGPLQLLFVGAHGEQFSRERALELERGLYTVFATVAGGVPGFAPENVTDARLSGRLTDPVRHAMLEEIFDLRFKSEQAAIERRLDEIEERPTAADEDERRELYAQLGRLSQIREYESKDLKAALETRIAPAQVALSLAERLRENGATSAARKLGERIRDDLGKLHGALGDVVLERALASAESGLGGALMDDNSPSEADTVLTSALSRLTAITEQLRSEGNVAGVALIRNQTANVLVSLAVNANVKLHQPDKALEYFERAYGLEQSDFMRVLLACYRARAGRAAEARAALRDVPISPTNYYNLGCTWALLGERELALDYLKRDFDELRSSGGSRERQKVWAKSDPDLASLHDDPRFQALVKPAASGSK